MPDPIPYDELAKKKSKVQEIAAWQEEMLNRTGLPEKAQQIGEWLGSPLPPEYQQQVGSFFHGLPMMATDLGISAGAGALTEGAGAIPTFAALQAAHAYGRTGDPTTAAISGAVNLAAPALGKFAGQAVLGKLGAPLAADLVKGTEGLVGSEATNALAGQLGDRRIASGLGQWLAEKGGEQAGYIAPMLGEGMIERGRVGQPIMPSGPELFGAGLSALPFVGLDAIHQGTGIASPSRAFGENVLTGAREKFKSDYVDAYSALTGQAPAPEAVNAAVVSAEGGPAKSFQSSVQDLMQLKTLRAADRSVDYNTAVQDLTKLMNLPSSLKVDERALRQSLEANKVDSAGRPRTADEILFHSSNQMRARATQDSEWINRIDPAYLTAEREAAKRAAQEQEGIATDALFKQAETDPEMARRLALTSGSKRQMMDVGLPPRMSIIDRKRGYQWLKSLTNNPKQLSDLDVESGLKVFEDGTEQEVADVEEAVRNDRYDVIREIANKVSARSTGNEIESLEKQKDAEGAEIENELSKGKASLETRLSPKMKQLTPEATAQAQRFAASWKDKIDWKNPEDVAKFENAVREQITIAERGFSASLKEENTIKNFGSGPDAQLEATRLRDEMEAGTTSNEGKTYTVKKKNGNYVVIQKVWNRKVELPKAYAAAEEEYSSGIEQALADAAKEDYDSNFEQIVGTKAPVELDRSVEENLSFVRELELPGAREAAMTVFFENMTAAISKVDGKALTKIAQKGQELSGREVTSKVRTKDLPNQYLAYIRFLRDGGDAKLSVRRANPERTVGIFDNKEDAAAFAATRPGTFVREESLTNPKNEAPTKLSTGSEAVPSNLDPQVALRISELKQEALRYKSAGKNKEAAESLKQAAALQSAEEAGSRPLDNQLTEQYPPSSTAYLVVRKLGNKEVRSVRTNATEAELVQLNNYLNELGVGYKRVRDLKDPRSGFFQKMVLMTELIKKEFEVPGDFLRRPKGDFGFHHQLKDPLTGRVLPQAQWPKPELTITPEAWGAPSASIQPGKTEWIDKNGVKHTSNNLESVEWTDKNGQKKKLSQGVTGPDGKKWSGKFVLPKLFDTLLRNEGTASIQTIGDLFLRMEDVIRPEEAAWLKILLNKDGKRLYTPDIPVGVGLAKNETVRGLYSMFPGSKEHGAILFSPFDYAPNTGKLRLLDPADAAYHFVHEVLHAHSSIVLARDADLRAEVQRVADVAGEAYQRHLQAAYARGEEPWYSQSLTMMDASQRVDEFWVEFGMNRDMRKLLMSIPDELGPVQFKPQLTPYRNLFERLWDVFKTSIQRLFNLTPAEEGTLFNRMQQLMSATFEKQDMLTPGVNRTFSPYEIEQNKIWRPSEDPELNKTWAESEPGVESRLPLGQETPGREIGNKQLPGRSSGKYVPGTEAQTGNAYSAEVGPPEQRTAEGTQGRWEKPPLYKGKPEEFKPDLNPQYDPNDLKNMSNVTTPHDPRYYNEQSAMMQEPASQSFESRVNPKLLPMLRPVIGSKRTWLTSENQDLLVGLTQGKSRVLDAFLGSGMMSNGLRKFGFGGEIVQNELGKRAYGALSYLSKNSKEGMQEVRQLTDALLATKTPEEFKQVVAAHPNQDLALFVGSQANFMGRSLEKSENLVPNEKSKSALRSLPSRLEEWLSHETKVENQDGFQLAKTAKQGDLLIFDPPYLGTNTYRQNLQKSGVEEVAQAVQKGADVLYFNSYRPEVEQQLRALGLETKKELIGRTETLVAHSPVSFESRANPREFLPQVVSGYATLGKLYQHAGFTPKESEDMASSMMRLILRFKHPQIFNVGRVSEEGLTAYGRKADGLAERDRKVLGIAPRTEGARSAFDVAAIKHILAHEMFHLVGERTLMDAVHDIPDADLMTILQVAKEASTPEGSKVGVRPSYDPAKHGRQEFAAEFAAYMSGAFDTLDNPSPWAKDVMMYTSPEVSEWFRDLSTKQIATVDRFMRYMDQAMPNATDTVVEGTQKALIELKKLVRPVREIEELEAKGHELRLAYPDMFEDQVQRQNRVTNATGRGFITSFESRTKPPEQQWIRQQIGLAQNKDLSFWENNFANYLGIVERYPVLRPHWDALNVATRLAKSRSVAIQEMQAGVWKKGRLVSDARTKEVRRFYLSPRMQDAYSKITLEQNVFAQEHGRGFTTDELTDRLQRYLPKEDEQRIVKNTLDNTYNQLREVGTVIQDSHLIEAHTIMATALRKLTGRTLSIEQSKKVAKGLFDSAAQMDPTEAQRIFLTEVEPYIANPGVLEKVTQKAADWTALLREESARVKAGIGTWTSERRFGNYSVKYKTEDGSVSSRYFKTQKQRDAFARGVDVVSLHDREAGAGNYGLNDEAYELLREIDKRQNALISDLIGEEEAKSAGVWRDSETELKSALAAQDLTNTRTKRTFAASRKDLSMFDVQQDYATGVVNTAKNKQMRLETALVLTDEAFDVQPQLKALVKAHTENVIMPDSEWGKMIATANFTYYLGGNLSTMMLEPFQQLMSLAPALTMHHNIGIASPYKYIAKANAMWTRSKLTGKFGDPEIDRAMERWRREGVADAGIYQELDHNQDLSLVNRIRASGGLGEYSLFDLMKNKLYAVSNLARRFYSVVPSYNSEIALIAAYKLARAGGMTPEQAFEHAGYMKDVSMFGGGKLNRPVGLFSKVNRTMAQAMYSLQSYNTSMLTMFGQLIKESLPGRGLTPAQRWQSRKALAQMAGTMFAAGGALGLPFVAAGIAILQKLFPGYNVEQEVREALTNWAKDDEAMGGFIGDLILKGVPNVIKNGPDLSSRFAIGGVLGLSPYNGFEISNLFGPTTSIIQNAIRAGQAAFNGDAPQAIEDILPQSMKHLWQSASQGSDYKNNRGDLLLDDLTPTEQAFRAAGFTPNRAARQKDYARLGRQSESAAQYQQQHVAEKLAKMYLAGDLEGVREAVADFREQNPTVNPQTLLDGLSKRVEEQSFVRDPRMSGSTLSAREQERLFRSGNLSAVPSAADRVILRQKIAGELGIPYTKPPGVNSLRNATVLDFLQQMNPYSTQADLRAQAAPQPWQIQP